MRHKYRRQTLGKTPVKHFSTLVDNTGPAVGTFFSHIVFQTDAGVRTATGGVRNIKQLADTAEEVNVGDLIKYVNVCLQCTPRGVEPTNVLDNAGWLEWALITQKENATLPTVANIGVITLGNICTNFYREDCLMTGCFPIGTNQAMSVDLKFKLPQKCCKIRLGHILRVICFIRTSNSADARTDSHRLLASSNFKCYT